MAVILSGTDFQISEGEVKNLINLFRKSGPKAKLLGQGGYGTVTRLTTTTGLAVAVKRQERKSNWMKEVHENEKRVLLMADQKKMDRVVRILGYNFVATECTWTGYIVMECADYSGHDIVTRVRPLPEGEELRELVVQHAQALQQIHSLGYMHNDLKPENFLFFLANRRWKVCDLGLAYPIHRLGLAAPNRKCAFTPGYVAPEAARSSAYHTPAADWFAFGQTIATYVLQKPIRLSDGAGNGIAPPLLGRFVAHLISADPAERLGGANGDGRLVMGHPYIIEKRVTCEQCSRTFGRRSELNRHRKRSCGKIVSRGEEFAYKCDECVKTFLHKSNLARHRRTIHGGLRPQKCLFCDATFKRSDDLRRHVKRGTCTHG